jgi:hypothetical protein
MRLAVLSDACRKNQAEIIHLGYYGKFGVWLENIETRNKQLQRLVRVLNRVGNRLVNFDSRFFSPYIICIARKSPRE